MLLFKIMETSRDPVIRSNCMIALGDVAVRFSHLVDENNNKLYEGLSDKDMTVKKNTLMVLTYLILGSMIKVKGQLGEMAKCLEDEDSRIADLAKLFFTELSSNKDNAIYNNLPDGKLGVLVSSMLSERFVLSHQPSLHRGSRSRRGRFPEDNEVYFHVHRKGAVTEITSVRMPPLTHALGKTSRGYCGEVMSAIPSEHGTKTMARSRLLLVALTVQVRAFGEEAHRGLTVLSRQITRRNGVQPLQRNLNQGNVFPPHMTLSFLFADSRDVI